MRLLVRQEIVGSNPVWGAKLIGEKIMYRKKLTFPSKLKPALKFEDNYSEVLRSVEAECISCEELITFNGYSYYSSTFKDNISTYIIREKHNIGDKREIWCCGSDCHGFLKTK